MKVASFHIIRTLYFFLTLLFVVFSFLPGVLGADVQTQYAPLAPLPGSDGQPVLTTTPSLYITNAFKLGIGVAGALAVLAIAYNGIKYMLSDVITNKADAKKGIGNSLLGLVIALASFLILNTINPSLTNLTILNQLDTSRDPTAIPAPITTTFVLRYYPPRYQFSFQENQYSLGYNLTSGQATALGVNPAVHVRFGTMASCTAQKSTLQAQGVTGLTSCSKVVAYRNYSVGTLITNLNSNTFITYGPRTKPAQSMMQCNT